LFQKTLCTEEEGVCLLQGHDVDLGESHEGERHVIEDRNLGLGVDLPQFLFVQLLILAEVKGTECAHVLLDGEGELIGAVEGIGLLLRLLDPLDSLLQRILS